MIPGFHNISMENYLEVDALSASDIVKLLRSPAHYKYSEKDEDKEVFRIGTAAHTLILEPLRFANQYACMPEGLKRNGSFMPGVKDENLKAQGQAILESGKTILNSDEWKVIKGMEEAIWQHPTASELLDSGISEVTGVWRNALIPNMLCKMRIDWINKETRSIIDLKSCQDARNEKFTRDAYSLGYGIKACWYLDGISELTGIQHKDFFFVAQEKAAPYAVQVYRANEELLEYSRFKIEQALKVFVSCIESDFWPAYPEDILELRLPSWVLKQDAILF